MDGVIGHDAILRELRTFAASEEPPHAILLAGPESTGRRALAMEYARLLNCDRLRGGNAGGGMFDDGPPADDARPCGECRPCRLIAQNAHPDVIVLGPGDALCKPRGGESHERHPDSRDIRICQVRGLIELVSKYPYEARHRVIVIDPADRLGRDAAHTILKTLEEPAGHTVFILITAAPEALLETIVSRCRRIDVRTVPRDEIEAGLLDRGVPRAVAVRAAQESHGRPGRAIAFARDPDLIDVRSRWLMQCARVAGQRTSERFQYANSLAERWRSDRGETAGELDAWEVFWERALRVAAAEGRLEDARGATRALEAVALARADLQAQVSVRPAIELMLLSFPRVTMAAITSEEESAHHA